MDGRKAEDEYTSVQRNGSKIGLQYNINEWQQAEISGNVLSYYYYIIIID